MTTRRWSVMLVLALTLALTMPVATQAITAPEFFRLFPFGIFDPPFFGDLFFIDPNTEFRGSFICVQETNTALGKGALSRVALGIGIGQRNTAVGAEALPLLTTGFFNTGVGNWALQQLTTGDSNTAVGMRALSRLRADSGWRRLTWTGSRAPSKRWP
jgi:hypothetical protein